MLCPNCKREMVAGFLQSDAKVGITWVEHLLPLGLSYWKASSIPVSTDACVGVTAVPAHICKECRLFIGDYNHKE